MPSILDGLNIAKLSLSAQQYAMSVTQRNTVNVNNPNYTRQNLLFTDLTVASNWTAHGTPGVELWAARNRYLDQSISYELPALGENLVKYNALREIDAILQGTSGGGLGSSINEFFNSFTELSSSPTDSALRWQVMSRAQTMTDNFKRLYGEIQRVQTAADQHIKSGVEDVNILAAKIADLNGRIETAHTLGQLDLEYALRDERQQYIEDMQGKIGLLYFETESGSITVTTAKGDAIVLGNKSTDLVLGPMTDSPFSGIFLLGNNITSSITSGEIGGYIQVRDELIPGYLKTLDDMASSIITSVNEVHAKGYDMNGNTGENFFVPLADLPVGPVARVMSVYITNAAQIAAAGDNGAGGSLGIGDNNNAKLIALVGNGRILPAADNPNYNPLDPDSDPYIRITLGEAYASLIYKVGSDQRNAKESGENQQRVIGQLMGQRNAESGVSLNEEAINLIKFQQAYQASSRFVTVLNSLSAEILNFVR